MKNLSKKELLQHIRKYIEFGDRESEKIVIDYITMIKEKVIADKEKIDCKKYYCKYISFYKIASDIYSKYMNIYNTNNKKKLKSFEAKLDDMISKYIIKNIKINYQYMLVEQFVKIKNGDKNIDLDIIRNYVRNGLSNMGWGKSEEIIDDIVNQLIVYMFDKINIEDWQVKYNSIYSYIESWFRYSVRKVKKNESPIDIPLHVLTSNEKKDLHEDEEELLNNEELLEEGLLKEKNEGLYEEEFGDDEEYGDEEESYEFMYSKRKSDYKMLSLDKTESFLKTGLNELGKFDENKIVINMLFEKLKEYDRDGKMIFVLKKVYFERYKLKEIGKELGLSAERVRQIKNKALKILKQIIEDLGLDNDLI